MSSTFWFDTVFQVDPVFMYALSDRYACGDFLFMGMWVVDSQPFICVPDARTPRGITIHCYLTRFQVKDQFDVEQPRDSISNV